VTLRLPGGRNVTETMTQFGHECEQGCGRGLLKHCQERGKPHSLRNATTSARSASRQSASEDQRRAVKMFYVTS
jgi:hypothetical protein